MWIWQQQDWPAFSWDNSVIEPLVSQVRLYQGVLLGVMSSQAVNADDCMLDTMASNIVNSGAIEGVKLNTYAVRSSLALKLGSPESMTFATSEKTEALATMMIDAVCNQSSPLTRARLQFWHECLFPEGYERFGSAVGGQLRDDSVQEVDEEPLLVIPGADIEPVVRYEAPSSEDLNEQLAAFVKWFNESGEDTSFDPLVRAGIAHLWLMTLQPFEDGNGRIARLVADFALAQAEPISIRYYAMSVGIMRVRQGYYDMLEMAQKGDLDVTTWLEWFMGVLIETFDRVLRDAERPLLKALFWRSVDQARLAEEQVSVINIMLDGGFNSGISAAEYTVVAGVSRPTATRHLRLLLDKGCLVRTGVGRSTRYHLREQ